MPGLRQVRVRAWSSACHSGNPRLLGGAVIGVGNAGGPTLAGVCGRGATGASANARRPITVLVTAPTETR
jgi:hypothetical protein